MGLVKKANSSASTTISIDLQEDDGSKKPISDRKRQQLSVAREKSLKSRREALKKKLEQRLNELRAVLGTDLRSQTVERVAQHLLEKEEAHRARTNRHIADMNETIQSFKDELRRVRKLVEARESSGKSVVSSSSSSRDKPRMKTLSELSASSSRRILG